MSRIGIKPISVPAGVEVTVADGNVVTVKGPKGSLTKEFHKDMIIKCADGVITVERPSEDKLHKSLHGLTRTLVHNMVEGVTEGFAKKLEIVGVGYRAQKQGKNLVMNLGFSHQVIVPETDTIKIDVPDANHIVISGCDKQEVGQFACEIREKRPPEPYKGKGIRYEGEYVIRKEGRVRNKINGTADCPRLNVFRSSKHIYAQVIDDVNGVTLCSASSMSKDFEGNGGNKEGARKVGEMIAQAAKAKGIENVVFDRGGYLYHGRVQELADGAREGGLKF